MKRLLTLLFLLAVVFCTSGCIFSNDDQKLNVNGDTCPICSDSSKTVILSLNTSSCAILGEGAVMEYKFRYTYISELILDVEFGVKLPNGFIGVYRDTANDINYLAVRANNEWHWVELQ